jgi:transketolase
MHTFGASAPIKDVMPHFGFTAEHVVKAGLAQAAQSKEAKS